VPRVSKRPHPATRFRCKLGAHPKAREWESTYNVLSERAEIPRRGHSCLKRDPCPNYQLAERMG
jgi:hypothetical protein